MPSLQIGWSYGTMLINFSLSTEATEHQNIQRSMLAPGLDRLALQQFLLKIVVF